MKQLKLLGAAVAFTALAACGGGSEEPANTDTAAAPVASEETTSEAVAGATEAAETAATETADAVETAAVEATEAVEDVTTDAVETVEEVVADATETVEEAAADVTEAAEAAVADAGSIFDAETGTLTVAGLTGTADAGARVWLQCRTCHVLDEGVNRTGPSLYGIFGRTAGTVEGFRYSPANADSGITWTKDVMFEYLENPRSYIPGTYMAFPGLRQPQQRADVMAYIAANGGLGE